MDWPGRARWTREREREKERERHNSNFDRLLVWLRFFVFNFFCFKVSFHFIWSWFDEQNFTKSNRKPTREKTLAFWWRWTTRNYDTYLWVVGSNSGVTKTIGYGKIIQASLNSWLRQKHTITESWCKKIFFLSSI